MQTLTRILEGALERLSVQTMTYFPGLLAAAVILLGAWLFAALARRLILRAFKGATFDRFLRQTGIAAMVHRSGHLRGARLVAQTVYWAVLLTGALTALNAFNTQLTTRMIEGVLFLLPTLATAGAILLVGAWLAQFLGRSTLVWAVNEDVSCPRHWAAAVRTLIMTVAVVAAADYLNFARSVFLGGFLLLLGGAVLAGALAAGLAGGAALRRRWESGGEREPEPVERSIWNHL
jgi:uncharacterized membrane protein